jgi:CDP-glucose 4,6-dehydratase
MEGLGLTASAWSGRRVLVTGHTGFKGAWLSLWLQHLGARVAGLALPPEDPTGAFGAFAPWPGLDHRIVDVRDAAAVRDTVAAVNPDVVFHLAAQALVRRGYVDPFPTYATNVAGTSNILHAVGAAPSLKAVVVVTTDKVYANTGEGRPFRESDPLGGSDPYSMSKALAELLVAGWRANGLRPAVACARAGNVIGGGDRGENRLLPDVWRALSTNRPVLLRHPDAVRPWQFVLDPLAGYLVLAERLLSDPRSAAAAVNFGPDDSASESVARVVERALRLWGSGTWDRDQESRDPEATILRLDAQLAWSALGWRPRYSLDQALELTVAWWRAERDGEDLRKLALSQIEAYGGTSR